MKTTILTTTLLLFMTFGNPSSSFGQDSSAVFLDSVFVEASIVPVIDPADSTQSYDQAVINLHFDVIDDLGYLSIVVYDTVSGVAIGEFYRTRQELIDEGLLQTDQVVWPLFRVEQGIVYRIEVIPQNLSGAYTRIGTYILAQ